VTAVCDRTYLGCGLCGEDGRLCCNDLGNLTYFDPSNSSDFLCSCDDVGAIGDSCGYDCGSIVDDCLVCAGNSRSCCYNVGEYSDLLGACVCDNVNACGVCNVTYDVCGVCDGDNSSCALGAPCVEGGDCTSGWCSDGVCCDQDCEAFLCRSCSIAGSLGTCTLTPWDVAPRSHECPAAPAGACGNTGQCDGTGACQITNSTVSCGSAACVDGYVTAAGSGLCNDSQCIDQVWTECPDGLDCGTGITCKAACGVDSDCRDVYFCTGPLCTAQFTNGAVCSNNSECLSGHCVDGVCCNEGATLA
jgi:hypothetical protein